jgi:O-antigen/teichoic acid export membrane protein
MQKLGVLNNITYSAISQFAIYIVNLAFLPYLARILGTAGFGQVIYIQSIMSLIILIVDFGFSWSAIKVVSSIRNNKELFSKYFFSAWTAQWILTGIAGILLSTISQQTNIIPASNQQLFYGYLMVIGYISFPFWLLHGLENFSTVTSIQLVSKIGTLPLLFLMVTTDDDVELAILFFAICNLLGGIIFIFYIVRTSIVKWEKPTLRDISNIYASSWNTFIAKINISIYTLLIPIYIYYISGSSALGVFNLADKAKSAIVSLSGPIAAALFPRMSLLAKTEKNNFFNLGFKAAVWQIAILTPICTLSWIYAADIAILLGGHEFIDATSTIRWLSFIPLMTSISNILGMQILIPLGMEKIFSKIYFWGFILITILTFNLCPNFHAEGAAIALFISEFIVLIALGIKIKLIISRNFNVN